MTIALLLAAWGVSEIDLMGSPDRAVWIIVLLIQTVPYLAAIVMSLVSALPLPASLVGIPTPTRHQEPARRSAFRRDRCYRRRRDAVGDDVAAEARSYHPTILDDRNCGHDTQSAPFAPGCSPPWQ